MPKWSPEERELYKEKARQILIRKRSISCRDLGALLEINPMTALSLKEEIYKELRESIEKETVTEEIGKMQDEFNALILELWDMVMKSARTVRSRAIDKDGKAILNDKGEQVWIEREYYISASAKAACIKAIADLRDRLLKAKFDAGLFKKDWGNLGLDKVFEQKENDLKEMLKYIRDGGPIPNIGGKGANAQTTATETDGGGKMVSA